MIKEIPMEDTHRQCGVACRHMRRFGFDSRCYCVESGSGCGCDICIYKNINSLSEAEELRNMKPFVDFERYTG